MKEEGTEVGLRGCEGGGCRGGDVTRGNILANYRSVVLFFLWLRKVAAGMWPSREQAKNATFWGVTKRSRIKCAPNTGKEALGITDTCFIQRALPGVHIL